MHCVHIIDVTSPMLACTDYDELLEADGVTLSDAGKSIVDAELFKVQAHELAA